MSKGVFMIMAGGTGGHIFPALAVAELLKNKSFSVHWVGTNRGMEAKLVPEYGYDLTCLSVEGVTGRGVKAVMQAPFKVLVSIFLLVRLMRKLKVVGVLGMGGFVSGPGAIAAWLLRIPLVVHEQNAVMGITNRIASHFAMRVLEAFPGVFPANRNGVCTGNPVRKVIQGKPLDLQKRTELKLLVLGGSRGALAINDIVPEAIGKACLSNCSVKHQTGDGKEAAVKMAYEKNNIDVQVLTFIDDIADAYEWADLVISRSGALTVSELANAGRPAILIPYPWHKDRQQFRNAEFLVDAGAAVVVDQADLTDETLGEVIIAITSDMRKLEVMSNAALACAMPKAAEVVAEACIEVVFG